MGYLSTLHVVHRDLKPDNCLVEPERGLLKICDFGTAKMVKTGKGFFQENIFYGPGFKCEIESVRSLLSHCFQI